MSKARTYLRTNVFSPQAILSALDLAGGICSLQAYHIIYQIDRLSKDPYKAGKRNTVLPHKWHVRQACKKLHRYCDVVIPMKHYISTNGECIEFVDIVHITIKLCTAFGLADTARQRAIDMALTLDGAQLTNNLSFVMAGLKLVDLAVRNPMTGEYELDPTQRDCRYLPQSRKWCFPMKFCMGKETANMYQEEFKDLFQIFIDASADNQKVFPEWKPINFSNPADMAAIQKVLGIGGAAKVWRFFCHCCSLTSQDIVTPNEGSDVCTECRHIKQTRHDWECYCQPFCSKEVTARYQAALDELLSTWNLDMEKVRNEGTLKLGLEHDNKSVNFVPSTVEESTNFTRLLIKEMRLRGRSTLRKDLAQLQAELHDCLIAEKKMSNLIGQITESKTREEAMKRIMTFVPCIMHCENRVGIKIMTMLFIEGLSNYQGAKFDDLNDVRSKVERENLYIEKVQKVVRGSILGSIGNEAQWTLPVEKEKNNNDGTRKIGTINMENYKVRKCIDNIDQLIDFSIHDETRKIALWRCLSHYKKLMNIMRKADGNYTNEELEQFSHHSKEFFQAWIKLYGRHGVTNYIHMIGVGHMLAYMRLYGNLNKYSQQGWEALNALIRLFFFRRTNKGGKNSGDNMTNMKSKLVPIGRLIQRRMLWVCNLVPDALWDDDFVMPEARSTQFDEEDDVDDIILNTDVLSEVQ